MRINEPRQTTVFGRKNLAATLIGLVLALGSITALTAFSWGRGADATAPAGPTIRVGTYDSRALAVAYTRSEQSAEKLKALQQQRAEAVKAGDTKRVEELNAQGESMQVRLNLQGFSVAPVGDVLETVREVLPGVAQRKQVTIIVSAADYHGPSVEIVDVTDDLVQLFNPNAQTLKIVNELRKQKPVAIEVAARMSAKP